MSKSLKHTVSNVTLYKQGYIFSFLLYTVKLTVYPLLSSFSVENHFSICIDDLVTDRRKALINIAPRCGHSLRKIEITLIEKEDKVGSESTHAYT